jgi:hypothetical protein
MEDIQKNSDELFFQYLERNIVPLVNEANHQKDRYRGRFWGCFWTVIFLFCINGLFVLFRSMMHNRPISVEQLIIVFACAPIIIAWPLWKYRKLEQKDIFGTFLQFYGNWQHLTEVKDSTADVDTLVIPKHETAQITHNVIGTYAETDVEIRDTNYFVNQKKKFNGVVVDLRFPSNIEHEILLFEKSALLRKNKVSGMFAIDEQIYIPAAGYFSIFSPEAKAPKQILCSVFFESILDLKEEFKARRISIYLKDKQVKIFLEGTSIYFDHSNIWSKKINEARYKQLHNQFTGVFRFIEIMQELIARDME